MMMMMMEGKGRSSKEKAANSGFFPKKCIWKAQGIHLPWYSPPTFPTKLRIQMVPHFDHSDHLITTQKFNRYFKKYNNNS